MSLDQSDSVKEEPTRSHWFVMLLGGGFAWVVTDMLADYMLQGDGRFAAAMLHLALFLPIFWVIDHFALQRQRGGDKRP
ncbi:MAG TPA: hypothetical protein VHP33_23705 [Polyangiaceae bacterium]|nr:hypothetical protein [Polyangiaceae bacterium]